MVHSLEGTLPLDELGNAVVHLLHSVVFCEAHTPLVRDVIDTTLGFCVFTACPTDLLNV